MNTIKNVLRRIPGIQALYRALCNAYFEYLVKQARTERIFTYIHKKKLWAAIDSTSGPGSDRHQTRAITEALPQVFRDYNISTMLDIPCGDFCWMNRVDRADVDYLGADIVRDLIRENKQKYEKNDQRFQELNLITDRIPKVDLIFCRDCFVHFSFDDILSALRNICDSQSDLLLTTTFIGRQENFDILTGQWRPLNLAIAPFLLPGPLVVINEQCTEGNGKYEDKSLALWLIEDIRAAMQSG
ncbi:MAG: class I SAM-dependent methyltransferase [Gammaproteobacteria bacterium]|nr:class I SAM-dependent methyltransferase [Gammaproteobacteria bacterium]MDH3749225.1 class I SAM-dependent methyltransferase [Gammaproteobacteria bacterium]